jgi:hypothetical protein
MEVPLLSDCQALFSESFFKLDDRSLVSRISAASIGMALIGELLSFFF